MQTDFNVGDLQGQIDDLSDHIASMFITDEFNMPTVSWSAGTTGTYITDKVVDVTKAGYRAVAATLASQTNTWYTVELLISHNSNTGVSKLAFSLFRANASAESLSEGNSKATVLYIKS